MADKKVLAEMIAKVVEEQRQCLEKDLFEEKED